jgi:hypothetical protein
VTEIIVQLEADVESLCLILREAEIFSSTLKIAVQRTAFLLSEVHADRKAEVFSSALEIAVHANI